MDVSAFNYVPELDLKATGDNPGNKWKAFHWLESIVRLASMSDALVSMGTGEIDGEDKITSEFFGENHSFIPTDFFKTKERN